MPKHQATKTYMNGGKANAMLTLVLHGGEWLASRTGYFIHVASALFKCN